MVKSQRPSAKRSSPASRGSGPSRPRPPAELLQNYAPRTFVPAPDLVAWIRETFLEEDAPLLNEDHQHLRQARFGALWTTIENSRQGRTIVGQAELMPPQGAMGKWQKARAEVQIAGWFPGEELDFLLTFDAGYAATCSNSQFLALVEHELYHCGQERDRDGQPKFSRQTGLPVFAMRGHDVEEFIGVVRRYGAVTPDIVALVEAAKLPPVVKTEQITGVCGSCLRVVV